MIMKQIGGLYELKFRKKKIKELDDDNQKKILLYLEFLLAKKNNLNGSKKIFKGDYCGKIKSLETPLDIQKRLRNEWR